ncbi:hypothetical protein PV326_002289 [Microctonus aethiopoides]|nr:hypothetical protein PV326_002289 [Microctonus aethiopoides]
MTKDFRCSCPLRFYGGIRTNNESFVAYAKCQVISHDARFRVDIIEFDENIAEINVSSNKKMPFTHPNSERKGFRPIRGEKRSELKKFLRFRSARAIQLEKIMHCDKDLFQDGHTQDVPNLKTLH